MWVPRYFSTLIFQKKKKQFLHNPILNKHFLWICHSVCAHCYDYLETFFSTGSCYLMVPPWNQVVISLTQLEWGDKKIWPLMEKSKWWWVTLIYSYLRTSQSTKVPFFPWLMSSHSIDKSKNVKIVINHQNCLKNVKNYQNLNKNCKNHQKQHKNYPKWQRINPSCKQASQLN